MTDMPACRQKAWVIDRPSVESTEILYVCLTKEDADDILGRLPGALATQVEIITPGDVTSVEVLHLQWTRPSNGDAFDALESVSAWWIPVDGPPPACSWRWRSYSDCRANCSHTHRRGGTKGPQGVHPGVGWRGTLHVRGVDHALVRRVYEEKKTSASLHALWDASGDVTP